MVTDHYNCGMDFFDKNVFSFYFLSIAVMVVPSCDFRVVESFPRLLSTNVEKGKRFIA